MSITIKQMLDKLIAIQKQNEETGQYDYIGFRFENKLRKVGEICEKSKHNSGRDDERDFPEFESEEYSNMETLNGTSAWDVMDDYNFKMLKNEKSEKLARDIFFNTAHCYVIVGNELGANRDFIDLDDGEIVVTDAKVLEILF